MNWAMPCAPAELPAFGFQFDSAFSWAATTLTGNPAVLAASSTSGPHPLGTLITPSSGSSSETTVAGTHPLLADACMSATRARPATPTTGTPIAITPTSARTAITRVDEPWDSSSSTRHLPSQRQSIWLFYTAIKVVARLGCIKRPKQVRLVAVWVSGLRRDVSCV